MTRRKPRRPAQPREQRAGVSRGALDLPRVNRWIVFALVVATVTAYVPALRAPFVMDDADTIGASSTWTTLEGSPTAGRPLVTATLAVNYAINSALGVDQRSDPDGPNKAVGYRLFNLFLHLLTGALLFAVVRRALRERTIPETWRAIADPLAGAACALWLLHPIQSEVINYIVQRSEALASFFYLATLYASQRAWDATPSSRFRWCAVAVVAVALGMMSKEIVITAPLMVMLYDRAFRLPSWRALLQPGQGRGWLYLALWIVCLGTFAVLSIGARGETAGFGVSIPWYKYLYTQCWAIAHYLRLVAWPVGLSIDYGYTAIYGARGIAGAVLLTVLGVSTLIAWTDVPRYGWFAFLGSWFFLLLAPSSSIVPVASEVAAERRIYLALGAVLVLAVAAVEWLRRRFAARVSPRWLGVTVAAIAIALAVGTAARSRTYTSAEGLWRSAVEATPENPRALGNLGWALFKSPQPKLDEAQSVFARASLQDSTCHFGCLQYAVVLSHAGRLPEAVRLLERELDVARGQSYVLAQRALALDLMRLGDYPGAIPHMEIVATQFPTLDHLVVLGVAYLTVGRGDDAIATFRRVGTLDGGSPEMRQLSAKLEDGAHHPEALSDLQKFAGQQARDWL